MVSFGGRRGLARGKDSEVFQLLKTRSAWLVVGCLVIFGSLFRGIRQSDDGQYSMPRRRVTECVCDPDSGVRRYFLPQNEFDVCEAACTGGNKFAFEASEAEIVMNGYKDMAKADVEVCILCRDAVGLLTNLTHRMRELSTKFNSMHVTIIENDSNDDTPGEFRKWADYEENQGKHGLSIEIEHHTLRLARPQIINAGYDDPEYAIERAARYHRLSLLRNRCLLQAMKSKYDQLIVIDVDDDVDERSGDVDGIAHSYGLQRFTGKYDWDVTCANSVLQEPPGVTAYLYRNISEKVPEYARKWVFRDSLAFRDKYFDLDTFRFHERRIHTPYDEPYYVTSCFGGLAIYELRNKNDEWHKCSYESFKDDDCEHVSFHDCLRTLGWRVLFNPRMTVSFH